MTSATHLQRRPPIHRSHGLAPFAAIVCALVLAACSLAAPARGADTASGGTLRVNMQSDTDSVDPALAYYQVAWQWEFATCVKLLNYPDRGGPGGTRVIPEAAVALPEVSPDGRSYTFTVPPGRFHFNTGEPVTARTFQFVALRDLDPRMKALNAAGFLSDVMGATAFSSGKARTVPGIILQGDRLTFRLKHPAPDFLSRIALPFFCALPETTPIDAAGLLGTVPSAGPYYLKSWTPKQQFVLERNPNYTGTRPHSFDSIVFSVGRSPARSLREIESGQADYALDGVTPSAYGRLWKRYGPGTENQRLFVHSALSVDYLALNTSRPTFARRALRQAVALVIDRGALLAQLGAHAGQPAEQLLPPTVRGYRPVRRYPLGAPTKADLAEAKQLAAGAGRTVTLYTCTSGPCRARAALISSELARIDLKVKVVRFDRSTQFEKEGQRGEPFDIADESWLADYADPADFINVLLSGTGITDTGNTNFSYYDVPVWNRRMHEAAAATGAHRAALYAGLDADLAVSAPVVPYAFPSQRDFFSARIGCQTFSPAYGIDLAGLCLR